MVAVGVVEVEEADVVMIPRRGDVGSSRRGMYRAERDERLNSHFASHLAWTFGVWSKVRGRPDGQRALDVGLPNWLVVLLLSARLVGVVPSSPNSVFGRSEDVVDLGPPFSTNGEPYLNVAEGEDFSFRRHKSECAGLHVPAI